MLLQRQTAPHAGPFVSHNISVKLCDSAGVKFKSSVCILLSLSVFGQRAHSIATNAFSTYQFYLTFTVHFHSILHVHLVGC
jgi:hypothetical protein